MECLNLSNQDIKTTSETNMEELTRQDDLEKPSDDYLVFRSYQKGYDDLQAVMGLPEPNPLQKKKPQPRGKIKTIYTYIKELKQKFKGREVINKTFLEDIGNNSKNGAINRPRDYLAERRLNREAREAREAREQAEGNEDKVLDKLVNFFKDEEKIVYKRSNKLANVEDFNNSRFNLRKYMAEQNLKNNEQEGPDMNKTEGDSDSFQEEFKDSFYKPQSTNDTTLVFESRFESGNLSIVSKVSDTEYNMIMQNDINTLGYCQWFFFETKNTRKGAKVKFNLLNFRKMDSLFNHGMKVLIYSVKAHEKNGTGWVRGGKNLTYHPNTIARDNFPDKTFRTFSFEYEYEYDYDKVFFAYSHPYTYSDLCDYLDKLENDEQKSKMLAKTTLCTTIAGNKCELLTITNNNVPGECNHKKCIFLTARVHPGETNSSFMMQGAIDFLLSDTVEAERLRNKFIFKIIPMLNPDGVIHGCSRCELSGVDLNRKWRNPSEVLHPTIYHAKKLCLELHSRYKIAFFCDFHGHSKKKNIFIYGCQNDNKPFQCREFPWLLAKLSPECFNFLNCSYAMSRFKAGAARITLHEVLNIPMSYTLEASFYGSEKLQRHFTFEDLMQFGKTFCKALAILLCDRGPMKPRSHNTPIPTKKGMNHTGKDFKTEENKDEFNKDDLLKDLYDLKNIIEDNSDSGSESNVSEDELSEEVMNRLIPKNERKPIKKPPTVIDKTLPKRTNSIPITPSKNGKSIGLVNTSLIKPRDTDTTKGSLSTNVNSLPQTQLQTPIDQNISQPNENRVASPSDEDKPRSQGRKTEKKITSKSMKPFERDRYSQPRILASQLILRNYEKAEVRINHLNFPSKAQQRGLTKVVLEKLRDKVKDDEEKVKKAGEFFPKIHTREFHENNLMRAKAQLEQDNSDKLSNFTATLRAARSEARGVLNDRKRKLVTYQPTVITIIDQNKTSDTAVKGTWGEPDPKIIELLEKIISAKVVTRGELDHNFVNNQPIDPREFKYHDVRSASTNYMNGKKENHFFGEQNLKQQLQKEDENKSLSSSSILKRIQEQDMLNSARINNPFTDPTPKDAAHKFQSSIPSSISKRIKGQG